MKKSLVSILLAAALAGCSEDVFVDPSTHKDILNELPTFTASVESGQEQGKGSRAILDGININWQIGDQISIFNQSTAHLQYQLKGEGGGTTGTFQAVEASTSASATALNARIAIYPYHAKNAAKAAATESTAGTESTTGTAGTTADSYRLTFPLPITQTYTEGSFDPKAFPMLAVSETYDLAFRNFCGVLKLQLTGADKVRSITVTGNDHEFLAGLITTTFTPNGPSSYWTATELSETVTLDCGEAGVQLSEAAPTAFHITLPPIVFTKGFTVKVKNTAGRTKTIRTNQQQSIQRNQMLKMPEKKCEFTQTMLISGDIIEDKIPADATKLTFVPGSDLTGTADQLVSIGQAAAPAYLIPDESTTDDATDYLVVTSADEFLFNADCNSMFYDKSNLTAILLDGCNTSQVTNMSHMFHGCSGLTSLDVSGFNTSQVVKMNGMFYYCSKLTSIDVSGFNTSKVTDMSGMFMWCSSLTSLDVSGFNTGKVTNMSTMFSRCNSLTSLDLSAFDTSQVVNMYGMFDFSSNLASLNLSSFNTGKVTNMSWMFNSCSKLTSLDVSGFNTSQVTDMSYMFAECTSLTSLDVSGFNTGKVTNMSLMFALCTGLTSLDVSGFDTSQVTNMYELFYKCSSLTSLNVSGFNLSKVTNMRSMFAYLLKLEKLDLSTLEKVPTAALENVPAAAKINVYFLFEGLGHSLETGAELILHKELNFTGYIVNAMFYSVKLKSVKCTPAMKNWILADTETNQWVNATLVPEFKWINIETNEEMN